MKFERIKKINNKTKAVILVSVILIVGTLGFKLIKNAFANPDSSSYLKDQVVDGLSFENAEFNSENGISKYQVEVINDNTEKYSLKTINVVFKDSSGEEIITLLGYIGESLEINEKKLLDVSVDEEINDIATIEYSINK